MIIDESFGTFFEINDDTGNEDEKVVVFTFYPKKEKFEHYHIELSKEKMVELYNWLKERIEQ